MPLKPIVLEKTSALATVYRDKGEQFLLHVIIQIVIIYTAKNFERNRIWHIFVA